MFSRRRDRTPEATRHPRRLDGRSLRSRSTALARLDAAARHRGWPAAQEPGRTQARSCPGEVQRSAAVRWPLRWSPLRPPTPARSPCSTRATPRTADWSTDVNVVRSVAARRCASARPPITRTVSWVWSASSMAVSLALSGFRRPNSCIASRACGLVVTTARDVQHVAGPNSSAGTRVARWQRTPERQTVWEVKRLTPNAHGPCDSTVNRESGAPRREVTRSSNSVTSRAEGTLVLGRGAQPAERRCFGRGCRKSTERRRHPRFPATDQSRRSSKTAEIASNRSSASADVSSANYPTASPRSKSTPDDGPPPRTGRRIIGAASNG